mmetsp:Transcript_58852/g.93588  ORF Transcript_58852/g.93588 Transcript_58852/m.93588 type:complete len:286 (+) Transcript_58852:26-883(+)
MLHLNPYSVQFNSDPRPLHQISTNGRSMSSRSPHAHTKDAYATRGHAGKQTASASHPYIVAQQEKKKLPAQKATNNQAISSASSAHCHAAPTSLHRCRSQSQTRSNRKRKYIDTFEDDEHGQQLYTQSLIIAPPSKQHISEQTVMKSISMLQRMSLNQYSGALVPYKKPMASKSWQELIQTYYKNNKHCNVKEFTEIGKEHTEENQDETDCEMREKKESRKKRPIRLHSSYSGFSKNAFINSEELKKIANQCYVSNVANANRNGCKSTKLSENERETDNESMDCD